MGPDPETGLKFNIPKPDDPDFVLKNPNSGLPDPTELIQELRAKDECKTKLSRAFAALMTTKAGWASSLKTARNEVKIAK
uniref:Uncharacterized protein n=1 Tax=Globodera pallida TaxID=36090 RepID=A0A183C4T7_GLOPA